MLEVMLNLRKVVAIAICLAGSAMVWAQEEVGVNIDGVVWATRNVGAPGMFVDRASDTGMYYQWGSNIGWSATDPLAATDGGDAWRDLSESGDAWLSAKDPCPEGWRVPTFDELQALMSARLNLATLNGVAGRFFGTSDMMFLPAPGYRTSSNGSINAVGSGLYWCSGLASDANANALFFGSSDVGSIYTTPYARTGGFCIRCVKDSTTAIDEVSEDIETATVSAYYDILGRRLTEEPASGIYIVRYDNGTTKKVVKRK